MPKNNIFTFVLGKLYIYSMAITVTHETLNDVTKTIRTNGANIGIWYRYGQICLHGCMPQNFAEYFPDNQDGKKTIYFSELTAAEKGAATNILEWLDAGTVDKFKTIA